MKVIVIGAGIGGSALALSLEQLGIEHVLLEQAPALTEVGAICEGGGADDCGTNAQLKNCADHGEDGGGHGMYELVLLWEGGRPSLGSADRQKLHLISGLATLLAHWLEEARAASPWLAVRAPLTARRHRGPPRR